MPRSPEDIYSKQRILTWEEKLRSIPFEIKKNDNTIITNQEQIESLNKKLAEQIRLIEQNKVTTEALNARIDIITRENTIEALRKSIITHEDEIKKLTPGISEFDSKINPLDDEIKKLKLYLDIKNVQDSLSYATFLRDTNQTNKSELQKTLTQQENESAVIDNDIRRTQPQIDTLQNDLSRQDREREERGRRERERLAIEKRTWERQEQSRQETDRQNFNRLEQNTIESERRDHENIERLRQEREQTLWLSQERSLCEQEDRNDRDATARYNSDVQAASIKYHSDTATLTAQQQNETREITNRHQHQKQEEEARHKREFRELHHRRREVQIVTPAAGGFGRENTPASLGGFGREDAPASLDGFRREHGDKARLIREMEERHKAERERREADQRRELNEMEARHRACREEIDTRFNHDFKNRESREQDRKAQIPRERARRDREHVDSVRIEHTRAVHHYERLITQSHERRENEFERRARLEHEQRSREFQEKSDQEYKAFQRQEQMRITSERPERETKESQLVTLKNQLERLLSRQFSTRSMTRSLNARIDEHNDIIKNATATIKRSTEFLDATPVQTIDLADKEESNALRIDFDKRTLSRNTLVHDKNQLELTIKTHKNNKALEQHKIADHQAHIESLTSVALRFESLSSPPKLQDLLQESEQEKIQLSNDKTTLENNLETCKQTISSSRTKIRDFNADLAHQKQDRFLTSLKTNPQALLLKLINKIQTEIKKFDDRNPVEQSPQVRICIAEIERIIPHIQNTESEEQPGDEKQSEDALFDDVSAIKYYQLCGYLRQMQKRVNYPNENRAFGDVIENTFDNAILDPDECIEQYKIANIREMDREEWKTHVKNAYNKANTELESALKNSPEGSTEYSKLYTKGSEVRESINKSMPENVFENSPELVDANKRILQKTQLLLDTPGDRDLHREYKALAYTQPQGQSSTCNKVFGILLGFLGAAIIAASVAIGVLSAGLASPYTIGGVVVGAGILMAGIGIFRSGRSSGPVATMESYLGAANKARKSTHPWQDMSTAAATGDMREGLLEKEGSTSAAAPSAPYLSLV